MYPINRRFITLIALLGMLVSSAPLQAAQSAPALAVGSDGTLTIKLGATRVGAGKIEMVDAQPIYAKDDPNNLPLGNYQLKRVEPAAGGTRIVHQYPQASVTYAISLAGEDLKVSAAISNTSADKTLSWVQFNLPTFSFSRNADGNLPSWFWTYLQANPILAIHPSLSVQFEGAWAADDTFGIGLSSRSHLTKKSLWMAAFKADGIIPAQCTPQFFAKLDAEPGDVKTVEFMVRVSATHDFKHLLGNYHADYQTQVGPLQYTPDQRPWSFTVSVDSRWVTPANPLGYNGASRRLDSAVGAALFVRTYAPPLQGVGQGLIHWAPGGDNPRGAMYRPDIDIIPPAVVANLPAVAKGFNSLGLKLGMCARPEDLIWPLSPTTDGTVYLDSRNTDQLNALWKRFSNVSALGLRDAFYLDSTGGDYNSVALFKFLRQKLGPSVQLYSEYANDLTIPYAGMYAEVTAASPLSLRFHGRWDLEMYHWLQPQMITIVKPGPARLEELEQNQLTPLLDDYVFASKAAELRALAAKYQDDKHLWILPPPEK